jgi:TonB family protein
MSRRIKSPVVLLILAIAAYGLWPQSHLSAQGPSTGDANKPRRIRLGGDVHPVVRRRVEPKYPKEAIEKGIEGDVQAVVLFGTDGLVKNVEILSGDKALAESVSTALLDWRYAPIQLNGKPVEVDAPVIITFKLKPKPSVSDNEHPVKGGETLPRE